MEDAERSSAPARIRRRCGNDHIVSGLHDEPRENVESRGIDAVVIRHEHTHAPNVPERP